MWSYLVKGIELRNELGARYVPGLNVAALNTLRDSKDAPRYGGIITDTPMMVEQPDKLSRARELYDTFENIMEALKYVRMAILGVRRNPMFVPLVLMDLQTRVIEPEYIESYADTFVEITEGAGVNSIEYISGGMTF